MSLGPFKGRLQRARTAGIEVTSFIFILAAEQIFELFGVGNLMA
jgi:hypothetical protein